MAARFGLKINWKKCQLLQTEIEFLGHVVGNGKVAPSPARVVDLINYPEPSTIRRLQSFLGLANYFRKFVEDYAKKAKPLSELLKADARLEFGGEQRKAFIELKQTLASAPVLQIFDPRRETEVHTDASKWGYGAILLQRNSEDMQLHPVYFMSRKTTPAEQNYCSYKLEFLAVFKALEKFRAYLLGLQFKIVTDC